MNNCPQSNLLTAFSKLLLLLQNNCYNMVSAGQLQSLYVCLSVGLVKTAYLNLAIKETAHAPLFASYQHSMLNGF